LKSTLHILTIVLVVSLTFSCTSQLNNKTLKLAHGHNLNHPIHQAMVFMQEKLDEKSGGQLQLEIYPSQQLGTERQALELLQIGSLELTKVSGAIMENFAPAMKCFSFPYMFRNREHMYKVQDGTIGRSLLAESEKFWLRGLGYFDAGQRSFYTKDRQIETPANLEGLKIRVQESAMAMELVRSLGGSPTPISWGELYSALQQGVVDGAENNPPSFIASRHYEICKYYSLNEHTAVPDILVIGKTAWSSLSDQEKQWLQEASDEAIDYQRKLWVEEETRALKIAEEAGVEIIRPNKVNFAKLTEPLLEQYKKDERMASLINQIQSVQ